MIGSWQALAFWSAQAPPLGPGGLPRPRPPSLNALHPRSARPFGGCCSAVHDPGCAASLPCRSASLLGGVRALKRDHRSIAASLRPWPGASQSLPSRLRMRNVVGEIPLKPRVEFLWRVSRPCSIDTPLHYTLFPNKHFEPTWSQSCE